MCGLLLSLGQAKHYLQKKGRAFDDNPQKKRSKLSCFCFSLGNEDFDVNRKELELGYRGGKAGIHSGSQHN